MNTNIWSRELFTKAWDFASVHHSQQTYGGKEDGSNLNYLNHLGAVAMEVIWALGQTEEACNADLAVGCAILHDILEDTSVTLETLEIEFGTEIAQGVLALTKNDKLPKDMKMQDSLDRIKHQPKEIWMVKMADRVSNLSFPPYYWTDEKKRSYRAEGQQIFDALHTCNLVLEARLEQRISDYVQYFEI